MSIAQQISFLVEQLPIQEQTLVLELVRRINPDDVLTPADVTDVEAARAEYLRGETTPDSAVSWDS